MRSFSTDRHAEAFAFIRFNLTACIVSLGPAGGAHANSRRRSRASDKQVEQELRRA